MTSKITKNYLLHFLRSKVFECVLIYNYQCKSMGGDYCLKCTEIYCKELHCLAKVPKLGLDEFSLFHYISINPPKNTLFWGFKAHNH